MLCRRLFLAFVCLATVGIADPEARAQSSSSSGGSSNGTESINSPIPNPYRFLFQNGSYVDVTNNPRPQNLNPTGVNFIDCEQDLRLDFSLNISGFQPGDGAHIEVWAGTIDCTQDSNRTGSGAGVSHVCWEVAGRTGPQNAVTTVPLPYSIYARNVLRYEPIPPSTSSSQAFDPSFHNSSQGESACHVQTSDAAVPISIYFLPVNSSEQALGTAYKYPLNTDLVAPPPPPSVTLQPGDSLLTVSWTSPGDDPDITGYAVWSDPPAGGATSGGCSCGQAPGNGASSYVGGDSATVGADVTTYRCIDAASEAAADGPTDAISEGMESSAGEASTMEGSAPEASMPMPEASTDGASEAAAPEAGPVGGPDGGAGDAGMANCNPINGGGGGACNSYALTGASFVVGNAGTTGTADSSTDDSGSTTSGSEGGVTLGGGGIAEIAPQYKGYELDDRVPSPITLTGLTNGHSYVVVVTSIDGSGNVGPVSTPQCGQPEPTSDFWKTYKTDNGSASGCALEAGDGSGSDLPLFALGIAATAAAFVRRRRRTRR